MATTREPGRTFSRGYVPLEGAINNGLSLNSPVQAFERLNPAGARDYRSRLASHRRIEAQHLADERALLVEAKAEAELPKNERYWKPPTKPSSRPHKGRTEFGSDEYRKAKSEAIKRKWQQDPDYRARVSNGVKQARKASPAR